MPTASTSPSTTFGTLLRRHRLAAGLTQEALAERAGVSARGVQDLERGLRTAPRAETVRLLAEALGLDAEARSSLTAAARPELGPPPGSISTSARLHGPPVSPAPLVGREQEIAAVCALLRQPEVRLLTLTGPGGVGKTSLAVAVAAEMAAHMRDGVIWVDLASLSDPALVPTAVASALGARERSGQSLIDVLMSAVAGRRLLLVLDNCEHLLSGMPIIGALLAASSVLTILATSRARLRLRGERELPVGPLAVPTGKPCNERLEGLASVPAVRLFIERAQAVAPAFALTEATAAPISEICRRVDGLPLAIELAAVRVKLLPPSALLTRMERRLPLLSGGSRDAPDRQRTMRDTIAWSHDLLSPQDRMFFRRLAVFAGGFSLPAAEAVCTIGAGESDAQGAILEGLQTLLDQSLLRSSQPFWSGGAGEARFAMLETVREYALERLEISGEEEAARRAHAGFFLDLTEEAQYRVHGPDGPATLDRLETEHDNVRAALDWTIARGEAEMALRLAHACWRFWWMHSHFEQARRWLERALAVPGDEDTSSSLHPLVLVEAGYFARVQGDYAQATARGEEALATAQADGDTAAMAAALFSLGLIALDRGELEQARAHHEAALRLESEREYSHGVAMQLVLLGEIAVAQGRLTEARALGEEALAIWRVRGDAWGMSWALLELGRVAHAEGDEAAAVSRYLQSLTSYTQLGDKEVIIRAIAELAAIACDREQFSLAARLYGGVYALREALSAPLSPVDRVRHEHAIAATRTALDDEAFSKAWDEGRAMTVESVIAEAERLDGEEGLRHRFHLRPS